LSMHFGVVDHIRASVLTTADRRPPSWNRITDSTHAPPVSILLYLLNVQAQSLVTIQVNILSMYKHIQGRTSFFTPARFKSCLFFKFLLIYSKPCLVQLPRAYSFQKMFES
jgi:hypothetical protein